MASNYNEELIERWVRELPYDVFERLRHLSKEDYDRILSTVREKTPVKGVGFDCEVCGVKYTTKSNLKRHVKQIHGVVKEPVARGKAKLICDVCGKTFSNSYNRVRHMTTVHADDLKHACTDCQFKTNRYDMLIRHIAGHEKAKQKARRAEELGEDVQPPKKRVRVFGDVGDDGVHTPSDGREVTRALGGSAEVVSLTPLNNDQRYDLMEFLREHRGTIKTVLEEKSAADNIKYYLSTHVRMVKYAPDGTYEEVTPHFRSGTRTILQSMESFEDELNECFQKIFTSMEEFLKNGSGYQLDEVLGLDVTVTKFKPLMGGSYIPLPETLYKTKCLLNVKNTDNQCFMWSVLAQLHPVQEGANKVESYRPHVDSVNMNGIDSPTPLSHVYKFERQNVNISINIFGFEGGEIFPLHITKKRNCEHHVNLLFIQNEKNWHYVLIKQLNSFLNRCKSHHGERFFCTYCMQSFTENEKLQCHMEDCRLMKPQKITLPNPGEVLEFKNVANIQKHPFIIYADFECFTSKLHTCKPNPESNGGTHKYQKMDVFSYAYQRVSTNDRYSKPMVVYRGPDPVQHFLNKMVEEQTEIMNILSVNQPMKVNKFVEMEYKHATSCYVCKKGFSKKNGKVIDHDHLTGDVRGIACNNCNLRMKRPTFVPCVLHNLSGFDGNLIMNGVGKFKEQDIKVIPYNKEKYLSFTLGHIRFIDSLHFLNNSLSSLARNLAKDGSEHFRYLRESFPDPDIFPRLQSKQFFPYDYVSDASKLEENSLPPRDAFHNKLTDQDISEEDYQYAQQIWRDMDIKTLGEYSDMYLKTDVALLTDVFERFRCICLQDYALDPAMYVTLSSFSWDAMLRYTGVVLDPLTDVDMLIFLERGIRGGVSSSFQRYNKANNMYLGDEYDPGQADKYIGFFDAVNLYGWLMTESLPYAFFSWLTEDEIGNLDIAALHPDSKDGYILEVDLEYPAHLHDTHSDYPLAPEKLTIRAEDLSPYSKGLLEELYGRDTLGKCEKLVPNLHDKERYVIHYRNLQLYTSLETRGRQTVSHREETLEVHRQTIVQVVPDIFRGFGCSGKHTNQHHDASANLRGIRHSGFIKISDV